MNKREAAVIGAYTGILLGDMGDMHKYIEELLGRPVFSAELSGTELCEEISIKSKPELLEICEGITE